MSNLKLWFNGADTYVAESAEHARALMVTMMGGDGDDVPPLEDWSEDTRDDAHDRRRGRGYPNEEPAGLDRRERARLLMLDGVVMNDALKKKVRGVLSRVFRDLDVFGGPLGWEIEARLLDEATPEIVALLEGERISGPDMPSPEEIAVEWFGGDDASPSVRASARTFVEPALRVRALFEKRLGKPEPTKPEPWYLTSYALFPGRFIVRRKDDETIAVVRVSDDEPRVVPGEHSVPSAYAHDIFVLQEPVLVDDDIVWTLSDCEGARDSLIARGDPDSTRLAGCHARRAEHLREVSTRPRPW